MFTNFLGLRYVHKSAPSYLNLDECIFPFVAVARSKKDRRTLPSRKLCSMVNQE